MVYWIGLGLEVTEKLNKTDRGRLFKFGLRDRRGEAGWGSEVEGYAVRQGFQVSVCDARQVLVKLPKINYLVIKAVDDIVYDDIGSRCHMAKCLPGFDDFICDGFMVLMCTRRRQAQRRKKMVLIGKSRCTPSVR